MPTYNKEFNNSIGNVSLPYFDGSNKCSTSSWIQNLDAYFQLNPMAIRDSIKIATLHLDGEGKDWWFHGMKNLGHDKVTSYEELTRWLMDRFERKDLKMPFREIALLRHT